MNASTNLCTFTRLILAVFGCLISAGSPARAADVHVACASNFSTTLQKLAAAFERNHPHRLRISNGSTGKLYAQIQQGAPFDLFLSADRERPALLHELGLADAPVTYAVGRLVLYAPVGDPRALLEHGDFKYLAIANPLTAPYGAAARAVLQDMKRWDTLQPRSVIGENIGQTFQFVHSGNAQLGFVALAQVRALDIPQERYWVIPPDQYPSLEQQAVLLRSSRVPDAARHVLEYLQSEAARRIIEGEGYEVP